MNIQCQDQGTVLDISSYSDYVNVQATHKAAGSHDIVGAPGTRIVVISFYNKCSTVARDQTDIPTIVKPRLDVTKSTRTPSLSHNNTGSFVLSSPAYHCD